PTAFLIVDLVGQVGDRAFPLGGVGWPGVYPVAQPFVEVELGGELVCPPSRAGQTDLVVNVRRSLGVPAGIDGGEFRDSVPITELISPQELLSGGVEVLGVHRVGVHSFGIAMPNVHDGAL